MTLHNTEHLLKNTNIPGTESYLCGGNPTLKSPYSHYELPFFQTRETLIDTEVYKRFVDNAISRFRSSETYKQYKGFLVDLGLDRCQVLGNITFEMADIEMHHNMLNIMDIAVIITEHTLNTKGYITTFDLVQLLKEVHKEHKVQLVMLTDTVHQLYHNTDGIFIHPENCFGNWYAFLNEYHTGITLDIAYKLLFYIKEAIATATSYDSNLLAIRDQIKDWSGLTHV